MLSDRLDSVQLHIIIYLCAPTPSTSTTMQFILRIALALAAFAQYANALATPSQQAMGVGFGSPVSLSNHPRKSTRHNHCIPRVTTRQSINAHPRFCPILNTQSLIIIKRNLFTESHAFGRPAFIFRFTTCTYFANLTAISPLANLFWPCHLNKQPFCPCFSSLFNLTNS